MTDRAQEIIEHGDPMEIIRMGLGARRKAEEGEYCTCTDPILTGFDLMCGHCLLENREQVEKREAAMRAPHPFQPLGDGKLRGRMCKFCSGWKEDPRHSEQQGEVG